MTRRWLVENRALLVFLVCFGFFRTAIADWNPIPSGSMRPTLLEGDVVLVDRLAYDLKLPLTDLSLARLGDPERGDVVTFSSPQDGTRLIKRLVGIPGDVIELRDEVLYINHQAAVYADARRVTEKIGPPGFIVSVPALRLSESAAGSRTRTVQIYTPPNFASPKRNFGPVVVPADHYFMLGDNRDNSEDSRYIGFVPRELIIGHAHRVLVSADIKGNWVPRLDRLLERIE